MGTNVKHEWARMFLGRKRGGLGLEQAILIAVVVAAMIAMRAYIKRAICGRWREAADSFGYGRQYEP